MSDTDTQGVWKLPLDILMEVMTISRAEAAVLMRTCRLLYDLGPPYVLRDGVALHSKSQTKSFVSFMLADTARLAYMRSLDLGPEIFDRRLSLEPHGTAASFADLLGHPATVLDTLILRNMEKLLVYNPHLLTPLVNMTSLRRLDVYGVGRVARDALRMMRSHLLSATVALAGPLGYMPALQCQTAFSDVFSALGFSSDTLQEPDLSLGAPINPTRSAPVSLQFPRVRTLRTVLDTHFPQCSLLRLFPNLTAFHLLPGEGSFDVVNEPNPAWFMGFLRDANGKIGLPPSFGLLECSAEVTRLYPFGAHLTVSKLRLLGYLNDPELPFLRVVLAEMRPDELEVSLPGFAVAEEVVGMLRELGFGTLRVLKMNLPLAPVYMEQFCSVIDSLLEMNSNLKVVVNPAP
ncbi:hypothetical protein GSI_05003 [Ganoderma sinense ZZ0214-1]|uniref:F-box domain-containing protein n=1 Tax=Ganoderma sinense ZZ0214-1 TaxID=1077348 RepID=A0A2G8SGH5_9APHY|nr:hypothetical protein GSI_05003 [Ganoderma sinense ZZ0214-1]